MNAGRCLLFLHGIRNDDPHGAWLDALNSALRRAGSPTVQERGYEVLAPSYLDLLERDPEPEASRPKETYKREDDDVRRRFAKNYWLALHSLEAAGIRRYEAGPSVLSKLPPEGPHADVVRGLK